MEIDPVVLLAEELRATESALKNAVQCYEQEHLREQGEKVSELLKSLKTLYRDLAETEPTSALGAGELVRLAAQHLPFAMARYADHFREVADRLSQGRREHADLVWLRAMVAALKGASAENSQKAAPLLKLALAGAARPVVIFRGLALPESSMMAH
ncbi:MAG TPA: hypothetical protein VFI23_13690 [Rhizomicrobium sp.]|nr:hypothetical protein [Rhizomicrobium sp.]